MSLIRIFGITLFNLESIFFLISLSISNHSSASKSPTFRLIQEIYEDMIKRSNDNKISIEAIQENIENELSSIRNATRQMTSGSLGNQRNFITLKI